MGPGDVVASRFTVEQRIAAGGMGVVYRATDRDSNEPVALKLLHATGDDIAARFEREARVLADLRHPAIVRYVAHGTTATGEAYLAMEWLEGEDLSARLSREPITPAEAVSLAASLASALAVAHEAGVVHRDIKPSNVFLRGGRPDDPTLLDFGIARVLGDASGVTRTGILIGTPAYMSPEQIRGASSVDARSDLFSLGCVLYQCLAGVRPFTGEDIVAIMAKIVLDDAPRLAARRPDLPAALDELVARLLDRDPDRRPADARSVEAALRTAGSEAPSPISAGGPTSLTSAENRLVCVVLVERGHVVQSDSDETVRDSGELDAMRRLVESIGGRLERLLDGTLAAVITGTESAAELCLRAARCALALRDAAPDRAVALATGRAVVSRALPTGDAIERAAVLLRRARGTDGAEPRDGAVLLDEVTAALLEGRVVLQRRGGGAVLSADHPSTDASRRLLGRDTPCVGRDGELATLEALVATTIDNASARAVLVTGPPGVGKSRVRHELLRRLRARGDIEVWTARGDPMRRSPLGLLAQTVRHAAGLREDDTVEPSRTTLRARVARHVAQGDVDRVAEFLGEMCGLAFPHEASAQLAAARREPILMAEQTLRAWEDFLLAEAGARPVVLVLDDLQWGDAATVQFVDAALRNTHDRPLLVLALARPEVEETFPRLWADRDVTHLRLGPLPPKAAERLVRTLLGSDATPATIARIVDRAAGNPFYLEELIRAVAEGRGDDMPGTVLAMAQSRLALLGDAPRRALRAASIFGATFWVRGLAALLGEDEGRVRATLAELIAREIVVPHARARFTAAGEQELTFRHSILRDAAYATLTDDDRALGHRLAGTWLEGAGERDALALAQHFDRGDEGARAAPWYARAAEQALEANDLGGALQIAEQAERLGGPLVDLRLVQATAHRWRADYARAAAAAEEALRILAPRTSRWYRAVDELGLAFLPLGRIDELLPLAGDLDVAPEADSGTREAFLSAGATLAIQFFLAGRSAAAEAVLARVDAATSAPSPLARARGAYARGTRALVAGDLGAMLEHAAAAVAAFDEAGDVRSAALMRPNLAYALIEVGAYERALEPLRSACAAAERFGLAAVAAGAKQNLGWALARLGRLEEARDAEVASIAVADLRMQGQSQTYLALIELEDGELAAAEQHAREAAATLEPIPQLRGFALGALGRVLLAAGRTAEALEATREAARLLESLGHLEEGEALVRLVHAEALRASGDLEAAAVAARAARAAVLARAAKIADAAHADGFLRNVGENAATLALADELG